MLVSALPLGKKGGCSLDQVPQERHGSDFLLLILLALSWAIMSAIIFFVSATPASSSVGRRALVSTPWDRAFSFSFSGLLGFSLCREWTHAKASLVGFPGPATLATDSWRAGACVFVWGWTWLLWAWT